MWNFQIKKCFVLKKKKKSLFCVNKNQADFEQVFFNEEAALPSLKRDRVEIIYVSILK